MQAFRVSLQHNDSYAFREYPALTTNQRLHQEILPDLSGKGHSGILRCDTCHELLSKWDEPLSSLVITKRKYDISLTYDGVLIVSDRFKSVYSANGLSGLVFRQLPADHVFFAVHADRFVEFDAERRKTRFVNPCARCGRFESVVGATPVLLKVGSTVEGSEFVRTDLEFGSGDEKHPVLICGQAVAKALTPSKLNGLDLIPFEDNVGAHV